MLTHPTLDQLNQLGLFGMAKAFGEAEISTEAAALTDPEWLVLLLDREMTCRHDKKLAARLRYPISKFKGTSHDIVPRAKASVDGRWSAMEIQSSDLQQRLFDWFDPNQRVDRELLRQLGRAVTALTAGKSPPLGSALQAQMLLAQVLFISYLEHREIIGGVLVCRARESERIY